MKCMVIDGNSIINRAYYGIRPLTNRPSQGGRGVQGHPEAHAGGIADAGAGAERGAGYPEHPPL